MGLQLCLRLLLLHLWCLASYIITAHFYWMFLGIHYKDLPACMSDVLNLIQAIVQARVFGWILDGLWQNGFPLVFCTHFFVHSMIENVSNQPKSLIWIYLSLIYSIKKQHQLYFNLFLTFFTYNTYTSKLNLWIFTDILRTLFNRLQRSFFTI